MQIEIDTRGMNASNYDPDNDPTGAIGIALANEIDLERRFVDQESAFIAREYWGDVAKVVLGRVPMSMLDDRGRTPPKEIKRRFRRLRELGYEVPKYSNMGAWQLRKVYQAIKRDVLGEATNHCPNVLEEIAGRDENMTEREFQDR